MHTLPSFRPRISSLRESRLVYQNAGERLNKLRAKITEKEKKEKEGKTDAVERKGATAQEKRIAELTALIEKTAVDYDDDLKDLPEEYQNRFRDELAKYFVTTIEVFDKNGVPGLNLTEFQEYKKNLMQTIVENMKKLGFVIEDAKKKGERKKQEEKRKKEFEAKTLADTERELQSHVIHSVESLELNIKALQDPENTKAMQEEFIKYQKNMTQLQRAQSSVLLHNQRVMDFYRKGVESMETWSSTTSNVVGASVVGAAVAGAAIGTALGWWSFGIGTVIGAAVGAAIAYGAARGATAEINRQRKTREANRINAILNTQKKRFRGGVDNVRKVAEVFRKGGAALNRSPEAFRKTLGTVRALLTKQFAAGAEASKNKKASAQENIKHLQSLRDTMSKQSKDLADRGDAIEKGRKSMQEQGQKFGNGSKMMQESRLRVDQAIKTLLLAQFQERDPKRRKAITERVDKLQKVLDGTDKRISSFTSSHDQLVKGDLDAKTKKETVDSAAVSLTEHEAMLTTTEEALNASIKQIDENMKSMQTAQENFLKGVSVQEKIIDSIDKQIGEKVMAAEIHNVRTLGNMQNQLTALDALEPVQAPGFFGELGSGFQWLGSASRWLFCDVVAGNLDSWSAGLKDLVEGIPLLEQLTHVVANVVIDLPSGMIEGAGEIIDGLGTMIANPVDTFCGLGALVGLNPEVSAGEAWLSIGQMLIAYEEFSNGEIGKGVGKVATNVLLTVTGAGAAGTGARAAGLAFRAARAAGAGVARATAVAGFTALRVGVVQFGANAVRIPGNIARGVGVAVRSPVSVARYLRMGSVARIDAQLTTLANDLSRITMQVDDFTLAGRVPAHLIGVTADDIAALVRNGAALNKLGINSAGAIRNLLHYQGLLRQGERIAAAMDVASHARGLLAISPGLRGLMSASQNETRLTQFIERFNQSPTRHVEHAYEVVATTPGGGLVAFDAQGFLVRMAPDEIAAFVERAANNGTPVRVLEGAVGARRIVEGVLKGLADEAAEAGAREPVIIRGRTHPSTYHETLQPRTFPEMQTSIAETVGRQRALVEGGTLTGKSLEDARALLTKMQREQALVDDIIAGNVTLDAYQGIRDIKKIGLTMADRRMLAQQILRNSGQTIDDVIRLSDTLPAAWLRRFDDFQLADDIAQTSILPSGRSSLLTPQRLGNLDDICRGPAPLNRLDDIINALPDGPERTILRQLSDELSELRGVPLDDAEKALILRESMEYLRDYQAALEAGGFGSNTTTTVQDIYRLMSRNQRNLAHQTIFDRRYLTGSDHGVLHVLEADMRWGMQIADRLVAEGRMTPQQRLLLRQATIDHDMGYAFSPLDDLQEGGSTFFAMTKDHPLYSALYFDEQRPFFRRYFGDENVEALRGAILDHSDAANTAGLAARGGELINSILAQVDCMGVSADFKMMRLFQNDEMMAMLMRAYDVAEEGGSSSQVALQSLKNQMLAMVEERYLAPTASLTDRALGLSYQRAITRFFDPTRPQFAFSRDFGSHSITYGGLAVEGNTVVTTFRTNPVFDALMDRGQPQVAAQAIGKVVDDFGYHPPTATQIQALRAGRPLRFEGGVATFVFERGAAIESPLQAIISRETLLKGAIEALGSNNSTTANRAFAALSRNFSGHTLATPIRGLTTPQALLTEAARLTRLGGEANLKSAAELLRHLRAQSRGRIGAGGAPSVAVPSQAA